MAVLAIPYSSSALPLPDDPLELMKAKEPALDCLARSLRGARPRRIPSTANQAVAAAKTKLSFAFVTDPTHEMFVYALRQDLVRSDKVELELVTLAIPALVQGFLGRQLDGEELMILGPFLEDLLVGDLEQDEVAHVG